MVPRTVKQGYIIFLIAVVLIAIVPSSIPAATAGPTPTPTPSPTPKPIKTISFGSSGSIVNSSNSNSLTVNGTYIKNSSGNIVHLRGVDYSYFIDGPLGSWTLSNGNIEWNTWDTTAIANNLDTLKSWGVNCIRVSTTVQWWVDNTNNFRSNIGYFLNQTLQRGIYVEFVYWRNNQNEGQVSMPYPPYDSNNGYISSQSDFVNLWTSTASVLKAYPNAIFELWNEPVGDGSTTAMNSWFSTTQLCINAIRATGSTNLIVVQWAYGVADQFNGFVADMSWVTNYPLSDSAGNIVYSTHLYSHPNNFYNGNTGAYYSSITDVTRALTDTLILQVAASHPVFIGEIGCSLSASDMTTEYAWYNNTLSLLDQYGISYAGWAWAPWNTNTQWGLIMAGQSNYAPSQAGQILQQQIKK